jgi:hypothetical protein
LTGKVYDPAGNNPLFNVIVFIPRDLQGRIAPIAPGTSTCNACQDPIGDYVAATLTDEAGSFTLAGMPTGQNVPVVFQSGKWRREVFLTTQDCASTEVPAELSRLPRNQAEGDIPQMALVTGQCDRLACFLRSAGLDASEFTGPDRSGRLHVYRGAGPGPDLSGGGGGTAGDCSGAGGACPLWSTRQALERYHTVFLGCECAENNQTKPDMTPMHDWLDEGGQVFAIHAQDTWFKNGPADFQALATWVSGPASGATGPFSVDTSTPRGTSLDKWLANVAALNSDGTLPLAPADVSTSVSSVNSANAARWVYDTSQSPPATKYFSFGTPVGGIGGQAMVHCGRGVFSDVHVSGGGSMSSAAVPASCSGGDLSAEDKVLEFFLFDLPVCLETVTLPPPPPQCR